MTVSLENFGDFLNQVLLCPSRKFSPVIFGLLPYDFDRIQFGTVGRKVKEDQLVIT